MTETVQPYSPSVDLLQALLWQYEDAAKIQSLLADKQAWFDENQAGFWEDWVRDVFDLRTANDFGLSVWSIILDLPLTIVVQEVTGIRPAWGFGANRLNFNNGNFRPQSGSTISLTTEQKRFALRLRYFQLANRGSVMEINRFLKYLFTGVGKVYVEDGLDMTMEYVFKFTPSAAIRTVLTYYDLLPRPAGVGVTRTISITPAWGFGQYRKNFNNGTFVETF